MVHCAALCVVQSVYNAWLTVQVCVWFGLCIMPGSLCRSVYSSLCRSVCVVHCICMSVVLSVCNAWFTVQVCV